MRGAHASCSESQESERTPLLSHHVQVPSQEPGSFSFKKLWAFTGPGFLISIAFLDPGNIEADLEMGSLVKYKLLWVVLWSCVLGLLMQRLAARLGTVTGLHLAEHCHRSYRAAPRILVWIMVEMAIIGNDMQEVIGTAIAFYLLSNNWIPVWAGVIITILDTFTFLLIDKYGLRKLELLFAFFISIMAITFGYEYVVSEPEQLAVTRGVLVPVCEGCGRAALTQAVAMVGAIIPPHNLYLHSALVKSRDVDRKNGRAVREANRYYFIETSIAVLIAFIINLFIVSGFGKGLYQKTNVEVRNVCLTSGNPFADIFPNNTDVVEADMYTGGIFLGCQFGMAALYIWGVGLLAAGQSSTMTGCYSGQFAMEGFLQLRWSRWRRVLFTRTIAILPTFAVAFFSRISDLSAMNDYLNAIMSMQLPFALFPLIAFTGNKTIMKEFVNTTASTIFAIIVSAAIIGINLFYVVDQVALLPPWWLAACCVVGAIYLSFCAYLALHMLLSLGVLPVCIADREIIRKYVYTPDEFEVPATINSINSANIPNVL